MNKIVNVLNGNYEPISYSKNYVEQIILEKDREIERLNNIIDELENFIKTYAIPELTLKEPHKYFMEINIILDKLRELKGGE